MATLRKITLNWEIRTGAITCDTGYIKRQELCDVDLYVTVDGTPYALDTSWALNLSIKPALLGDNAALVAVTTWTASATTGLYQATAQTIGGTALDTYLAANNADTTDDEGNKLVDLDVYYTVSMAMKAKSDTVTVICKPDVGRADDTVPAAIIARNDFLVSNGTGLLVNVAAGYAANGAFVAAQSSVAITNATNYIEVSAAGVVSVNTTAFTAGSYPLATVVASAGAITSNTDLRAWITPKPGAAGGVTSITGTANEITVTGTTTPTLSLPSALTFTGKTVTGGTFTGGAFNGTVGATTPDTVAGTTGTFSGTISTTGVLAEIFTTANQGAIYTLGNFSDIYTTGADSTIFTQGADATINTEGANANIYTVGLNANIYTSGANAHIYTSDAGAYIQTRSTFKLNGGTYTTTLSHAATANRAIAFPDAPGTLALVSGDLGTPSVLVGTNITGTAAGLTAGNVTTNANLTGHVTSVGNATVLGSFTFAQLNTAVSDDNVAGLAAANTFTAAQAITGGSLAQTPALSITSTNASSGVTQVFGTNVQITSSGSGTFIGASRIELLAGYSGTGSSRALYVDCLTAGTGNDFRFSTSYAGPYGNQGGNMWANATTTGLNVGNFAEAGNGSVNVGLVGKAITAKNSATNIGVLGTARNTGTSPIQIGGFFGLYNATPTFASAALMADNGSTTSDIFVARDNGTAVFTIADGGGVTLTQTLAVTGASTITGLLTANGGITLGDAQNIAFNTTTGTKIGTATTQKFSFWNATPIVQPTAAVASATVASPGAGTNIKTDDTFDGYTIAQVVRALRNAGLLA